MGIPINCLMISKNSYSLNYKRIKGTFVIFTMSIVKYYSDPIANVIAKSCNKSGSPIKFNPPKPSALKRKRQNEVKTDIEENGLLEGISVGQETQTFICNGVEYTKTITITANPINILQCSYCTNTYKTTTGLHYHVKNKHTKGQYEKHIKKWNVKKRLSKL
jgi:hypothetical protein